MLQITQSETRNALVSDFSDFLLKLRSFLLLQVEIEKDVNQD